MDLHWQPGLNYFQQFGFNLVIVPHWNNAEGGAELDTSRCFIMGAGRFDELCSLLTCEGTILGIDEHTSIWIDINASHARVFGKGNVHLIRNGTEVTFASGGTSYRRTIWVTIKNDRYTLPVSGRTYGKNWKP